MAAVVAGAVGSLSERGLATGARAEAFATSAMSARRVVGLRLGTRRGLVSGLPDAADVTPSRRRARLRAPRGKGYCWVLSKPSALEASGAGTTSAFQIPPRPRAARAPATPPPRSAKTSAPAASEVASSACSSPETSHGAFAASTRASAHRHRPGRAPVVPKASSTTADTIPAPALRLAEREQPPHGQGHPTRRPTPGSQRAPATAARRTRAAPASAPSAAARPRRGSTRPGTPPRAGRPARWPGRAAQRRGRRRPGSEQHRLLQQHPRDDLVEHRDQGIGGDRARQTRTRARGTPAGGPGPAPRPCRS